MSGVLPFIKKEDPEIPDFYGIKIHYLTGKCEEFEGIHNVIKQTNTLEIVTKDDIWSVIPFSAIVRIEFDKRFSKLVEIRKKVQNGQEKVDSESNKTPGSPS